ncbi:MAG: prefoldin subunit alpha [archaeon]
MEKDQQELMFRLSMFEQQMQQSQQQLQAIEQGIIDMTSLNIGLDELIGSEGKEIFAPIGRGIFAKTKLLSEKLIVDVGGKNFVNKSIPETKKIINQQIKRLEDVKKELEKSINYLNEEFMKLILEAQSQEHIHRPECEHEE